MQFLLSKSFRQLSRSYSKAISVVLPELRLEHFADILLVLGSGNRPYNNKELSEMLLLDKSRISILIYGLMNMDLVNTSQDKEDRRKHVIMLTDKGKEIIPMIQHAIESVNTAINQQLDQTQLDHFYSTLVQMQRNLSQF